jgi:hypothetical protein
MQQVLIHYLIFVLAGNEEEGDGTGRYQGYPESCGNWYNMLKNCTKRYPFSGAHGDAFSGL